jgi:hypothetical protein
MAALPSRPPRSGLRNRTIIVHGRLFMTELAREKWRLSHGSAAIASAALRPSKRYQNHARALVSDGASARKVSCITWQRCHRVRRAPAFETVPSSCTGACFWWSERAKSGVYHMAALSSRPPPAALRAPKRYQNHARSWARNLRPLMFIIPFGLVGQEVRPRTRRPRSPPSDSLAKKSALGLVG